MQPSKYKVLISTSGLGSRLDYETQYLNKALLRVGTKAVVSYILEKIPEDIPIVVTIGYKGDLVREYLTIAHPERHFEFVEVEPYKGKGSSLGFSLLQAKKHLNCPFIFSTCDTITDYTYENPRLDWVGICQTKEPAQYTLVSQDEVGRVSEFYKTPTPCNQQDAYIGLCGIKSYTLFWKSLEQEFAESPDNESLNDVSAFSRMIQTGAEISAARINQWLDTGNKQSLLHSRAILSDGFDNLPKFDEEIYFQNSAVIKFFNNKNICKNRVLRNKILHGLVPNISQSSEHFYKYPFTKGALLGSKTTPDQCENFLYWAKENLWKKKHLHGSKLTEFFDACEVFYKAKTQSRTVDFFKNSNIDDQRCTIDGESTEKCCDLLQFINWDDLSRGTASNFHGDLHFENIIEVEDGYSLIDWRQDFGGILEYGDLYYDLAKLNHGTELSHDSVRNKQFSVDIQKDRVELELVRPSTLINCQEVLKQFVKSHGYSWEKVELLTALIYLNIASLHEFPYSTFLHYFGRKKLNSLLQVSVIDEK